VFARVAPEHKVRIVDALRARDEVVAMTGDGVNDAPALKRADIGIAMGVTGTDVAKEAATMVLTDDNFASIVTAVHRGRGIYDNIVKFVRFQLTTNVATVLVLVAAAALDVARPFAAIHVLWVNLITDGPPGVALGLDRPAPDAMSRGPRQPGSAILTRDRLSAITLHGLVMAAGTLAVFWWAGADESPRATTLAFTTFVLFQVVNALNVRFEGNTLLSRHTLTNPRLWLALAMVIGFQVAAVQMPALHNVFDTTGLRATDWLIAATVALTVAVVEEIRIRTAPTPRHIPTTADLKVGSRPASEIVDHTDELNDRARALASKGGRASATAAGSSRCGSV
jgi:Ca2+-transporting ATPase